MKRIYILLLLSLMLAPCVLAQKQTQGELDSFLSVLPRLKDDTVKINLLTRLSRGYQDVSPQDGIKYGAQALALSRHLQWKKGEANALNKLGLIYSDQGKYQEALNNHNAALAIGTQTDDKNIIGDAYNGLGNMYTYMAKYPEALKAYQTNLQMEEALGLKEKIAGAYSNIASVYVYEGNHADGLKMFFKASKIMDEIGSKDGKAITNANIGSAYFGLANYSEALKYYLAALKLDIEEQNIKRQAKDYGNIELVYEIQGNYTEALKNNFNSLKLSQQIDDKRSVALAFQRLANVYQVQGNYSEALKYDTDALNANIETGDKRMQAVSYSYLGETYTYLHDYPKALKNLFTALDIRKSIGAERTGIDIYNSIAKAYDKQGNYADAEKYATHALEMSEKQGDSANIEDANSILADIYENTNQYKKALNSYKAYVAAKDGRINFNNAKKTVQIQDQYNFDVKEAAIQAAHDKQLAVAKTVNAARLRLWVTIGVAILAIVCICFFFYNKMKSDRYSLQLSQVRQEALNAQMNDHFIGNTMDSINNFIRNNDKEKASEYLILFSRLIRQVLESATERLIPLKEDIDILKDYIELEQLRFPNGNLHYKINIDGEIDMENTLIPPRVFQVLAENAIKHGFKKSVGGNLLINVTQKEDYLECAIEDNGAGRRVKIETAGRKRKSLGSSLAEKLIKTASRNFRKESFKIIDLINENSVPIGTRVIFNLPLVSNN